MKARELDRVQGEMEPQEDLAPYAGQWVALRDGKVIASDFDLAGLRANPEVEPEDTLLPVAHSRPGYFIA